jgi:5-(carboxyamino)imidazole ribonucleotide synthase
MVNLLGDLWNASQAPDWNKILQNPRARLHIYGKLEPRAGRKMGHYCVLSDTVDMALNDALGIRNALHSQ